MKACIIGLFCLVLAAGNGLCQEKVLIASGDSLRCFMQGYPADTINLPRLEAALANHYYGRVELHFGPLPDSLEQYDAIFTDLGFLHDVDSSHVAKELEKLSNFLLDEGKLYVELSYYTTHYRYFSWESPAYSEYPMFNDVTGVRQIGVASSFIKAIGNISGIDGRFTEGLNHNRITNPTEDNAPSMLILEGDIIEVLSADGNLSPILAWQHEEGDQKVVWHWPIVTEHYDKFIGRVVCNYFGLCEPVSVSKSTDSDAELSVVYDPVSAKLVIENADGYSTLAIYNTLGVKLLERNIFERTIELPNELPAGNYFVVASGVGRASSKGIIVWK